MGLVLRKSAGAGLAEAGLEERGGEVVGPSDCQRARDGRWGEWPGDASGVPERSRFGKRTTWGSILRVRLSGRAHRAGSNEEGAFRRDSFLIGLNPAGPEASARLKSALIRSWSCWRAIWIARWQDFVGGCATEFFRADRTPLSQ